MFIRVYNHPHYSGVPITINLTQKSRSTIISSKISKVFYNIFRGQVFVTSIHTKGRKNKLKSLKVFVVLALYAFLVFGCVTPSEFNRKLNEPVEFKAGDRQSTDFYNHRSPWDSPFNPHEVLQYWESIGAESLNLISVMVIVGNPKINWQEIDINQQDPFRLPIPKGEFASAVVFIFTTIDDPKKPELFGYGYTDKNGREQLYEWNKDKKRYTQFVDSGEQNINYTYNICTPK